MKKGKANNDGNRVKFDYKTKGMMAEIGKRLATLFGLRIRGFLAWWFWRTPRICHKTRILSIYQ